MSDSIASIADELFGASPGHGDSLALVVMHRGAVIFERYGVQPDTIFGPGGPVTADTTLISWSMAKSITHAAVGILVDDGLIDLDRPAAVERWQGTPKEAITMLDLLEMRPGLEWVEDYDDASSTCLQMLFGDGHADMAAYAAALPMIRRAGSTWNYSSGTTNIICRILADVVGGGRSAMLAFLRERLFEPAGMPSAIPKFDDRGTFIGSSYVYATARDFAMFGELYRNAGLAGGQRLLPEGWADHARTFVAHDEDDGFDYGRHWWMWPELPGSMACHGYEGQYTVVVPDRELVVVHLGKCPYATRTELTDRLRTIIELFAG